MKLEFRGHDHAKNKAEENLDATNSALRRNDYRVCVVSQTEPQEIHRFVVLQELRQEFRRQSQFRLKLQKIGASVGLRFILPIEFTFEQQFVAIFVRPNLSKDHAPARNDLHVSLDRTNLCFAEIAIRFECLRHRQFERQGFEKTQHPGRHAFLSAFAYT